MPRGHALQPQGHCIENEFVSQRRLPPPWRHDETVMPDRDPAKPDVFALALAAGLKKAVREFPDDVLSAAQAAAQDRDDMPAIGNTERPWPPMRMRSGR
jgi:hypothetical protein